MNMVPAVMVKTVIRRKEGPGEGTTETPAGLLRCWSQVAKVEPWMRQIKTVAYLVYWLIFLLPASPSFCNLSSWGMIGTIKEKIMEAVM